MPALPEDPTSRVGEADRDTAVSRLKDAFAGGYLSQEELDERLHQVFTAKTRGDLDTALVSLPAEGPGTAATIGAATGRIRRSGSWRVPRTLKVESALGRVSLDLSRAIIEYPVIDIEMAMGVGRATITVPRNATVEVGGLQSGWKDVRYKLPRGHRPGGPTIRITGAMGLGRLTIRHARR